MKAWQSLFNGRMLAVLVTSIASGFPLALTGSTLQAWYTQDGVNLLTIGLLSLVGLPYLLKVVWAPLMDHYVPLSIGRRKSWIVLLQGCILVVLLLFSWLSPSKMPQTVAIVAVVLAFFSASQDIVVDAYRTDIALPHERGMAASWLAIGYRFAMLFSGALALVFANYIGWQMTYRLMAGFMLLLMLLSWLIPKEPEDTLQPRSLKDAVIEPLQDFFRRDQVWLLVAFIVSYKIADALALALNTTFLLRGVGFDLVTVGMYSKTIGLVAMLVGGLAGGLLYPRLGAYRSLMIFGFLQMSSNLLFALLAVLGKSKLLLVVSIFGDYFCGGVATTAFVAFLMSLCNHRYSATQYALFSAIAALGRVFCGPLAAMLVGWFGWAEFYVVSFFFGLPSLWLLFVLKRYKYFSPSAMLPVST